MRWIPTCLVILCASNVAFAALSGNLINGGSFDGAPSGFIKLNDSPLTVPEGGSPVRSWQFHPGGALPGGGTYAGDWGLWIGQGAISVNDDPRALWNSTQDGGSPHNRSIITRAGSPTGVMEAVRFRGGVGQYMKAPALQKPGAALLDFDYFFNYWDSINLGSTPQILSVSIWGVTEATLPDWPDRAFATMSGNTFAYDLLYAGPEFNSQQHQRDIDNDNYRDYVPSQGNVWKTLSDGVTEVQHNPLDWTANTEMGGPDTQLFHDGSFQLNATYPYYFVFMYMVSYNENHEYFSDYDDRPTDTFWAAVDNMDLRLPVALLADTNLDGLRNALDIQSFVARVTGSLPYMLEADCNQDGFVNALDIQKFVYYITGGTAQVVPEPATLGVLLLALGGLRRAGRAAVHA